MKLKHCKKATKNFCFDNLSRIEIFLQKLRVITQFIILYFIFIYLLDSLKNVKGIILTVIIKQLPLPPFKEAKILLVA